MTDSFISPTHNMWCPAIADRTYGAATAEHLYWYLTAPIGWMSNERKQTHTPEAVQENRSAGLAQNLKYGANP